MLTKALDLDLSEPCFNIIDKIIFRLGIVSIRIWIDRRIDRSKSTHLLERHLHFAQQARIDGFDIIEDRRAGLPDAAEEIAPELTDQQGVVVRLAVTIRINIAGQRRGAPERSNAQEIGNDLNAKQRNGQRRRDRVGGKTSRQRRAKRTKSKLDFWRQANADKGEQRLHRRQHQRRRAGAVEVGKPED